MSNFLWYTAKLISNDLDLTFQCHPRSNVMGVNWKTIYDLLYVLHAKFDKKMLHLGGKKKKKKKNQARPRSRSPQQGIRGAPSYRHGSQTRQERRTDRRPTPFRKDKPGNCTLTMSNEARQQLIDILNQNKRPIGLIAPPFKINFLATENLTKMKLKSVRILQKIIHLASGCHIWSFFAQNHNYYVDQK